MFIINLTIVFLLAIPAVTALALSPVDRESHSASFRSHTKSLRIAVVGAGISGLNAALTLSDSTRFSPKHITIFDANNNIGGRMHTKFWPPHNQTSEWCGEFIDSNHYAMISLAKRFNIDLHDTINETDPSYQTTFYFLKGFYNQTQAWIDYQAVVAVIKQQVEQIGEINYKESNTYGRYFDNLTLYDWIDKYIPNGHKSNLGQYINTAYLEECGLDTQEQNSLNFLTSIDTDNQPENGPLSIYGLSDQRYRMRYGNYQLPTEISQHLKEKGISFQLKHNLTKIEVTRNKEIRLTFSNNRVYTFDHVILTIPTTTLRYVDYSQVQFSPLRKRIINELRYGTNTKLNLQFSKRFWYDLSADGIIYTDLPFLTSWEASSGQKGDTGILVLHTGGIEGTSFKPRVGFDDALTFNNDTNTLAYVNKFLNFLNEVWPNASRYYTGRGTVSAPWMDKYFLGSYPCNIPGQYSTFRGYEKQRQGNTHFAGDYTSVDFPGYMEGAVVEGERAANEIIDDYK